MTNLIPLPTITQTAGDIGNAAGSAPVPGAGNQMQGNPGDTSARANAGLYAPGNQNTAAQLATTQISNGNISLNSVPTNVLSAPGTDSLLAQMSRGQVILKDSTYGIAQFTPGNAGAGNVSTPAVVPVATGPASGLTYPATQQNHTGN
jgi:hypothetical protein